MNKNKLLEKLSNVQPVILFVDTSLKKQNHNIGWLKKSVEIGKPLNIYESKDYIIIYWIAGITKVIFNPIKDISLINMEYKKLFSIMEHRVKKDKFPLGNIYLTKGINSLVTDNVNFANYISNSLERHRNFDWGDIGYEDWKENELSLKEGFRLLSVYKYENLHNIFIITESDRNSTTILFSNEY